MLLLDKIEFINSFSFIYSPRPGTKASKLELIDKNIAKERLNLIQEKLFNNQKEKNKSLENSIIDVLVENNQPKVLSSAIKELDDIQQLMAS